MRMTDRISDMLSLLQDHAQRRGDQLAHVLPDRDITYRRLWSRIERGSARLYGEWGVRRGDRVAYVGRGHPDAIVLYFALLRIGAALLPLEAISAAEVSRQLAEHQPSHVIRDQSISDHLAASFDLQELLATWSHHDPVVIDNVMTVPALWLPDASQTFQPTALEQLCTALPSAPRSTFIDRKIFSADILGNVVLPSLRDCRLMQFSATDQISDTGS